MVRIVFRFNFIGFSFRDNLLKYHAFHINRTYLNYNFAEKHLSRMHDGSGKEHAVPGGERKAEKRSEKPVKNCRHCGCNYHRCGGKLLQSDC